MQIMADQLPNPFDVHCNSAVGICDMGRFFEKLDFYELWARTLYSHIKVIEYYFFVGLHKDLCCALWVQVCFVQHCTVLEVITIRPRLVG